jgi:SDR family mycofactocin-dependent oxidoreductase
MSGRVEGKVALITGAARGQGRAHALRLAQEGADVIAVDICAPIPNVPYPAATQDDLAETAREVKALGRRVVSRVADTRDLEALKSVAADGAAQLGKIDIVVANAGICILAPWDKVTPDIFRDTIDINLTGTWNTVMATAPHLVRAGGGSIVLVSSVAGLKSVPFLTPYVASKHAVTGLSRAFAQELAKDDVRVNSLHPTGVDTPMARIATVDGLNPFEMALADNPRLRGVNTNILPIQITEAQDQANAVLFLASDESRYITALAMTVDAGNTQH